MHLSSLHDSHNRFFSTLELSSVTRLLFCTVALDTSNLSYAVFIHYGPCLDIISVKRIFLRDLNPACFSLVSPFGSF